MSIFDKLLMSADETAWLVQYENSVGGHGWAVVICKGLPEPDQGQILAAYEVPDDLRYMHVTGLKMMARNGTLKKVETRDVRNAN